MNAVAKGCPDADATCCAAVPPEFVRLRYFFGQRLGVVDFHDEQSYHTGKIWFHNRHLHGAGVLCGLRVERFVFPQGAPPNTPTTVLRVIKGAALDVCGREIVVGADQCIDVNAWYQVNKLREEIKAWTPGEHSLCVGLRYRECPSDPMPAPRDPCGCEPSGCEFGRVRESFELALLTESEQPLCRHAPTPSLDEIQGILAGLPQGLVFATPDMVQRAIHRAVAADCPDAPLDSWLCLACFRVVLGEDGNVSDAISIVNDGPDRQSLLPSSMLQEMFTASLGESGLSAFGPGPRISKLVFEGNGADSGSLRIELALVTEGTPPTPTPIAEGTFESGMVTVHRYDEAAFKWESISPSVAYNASPPHILLTWSGNLTVNGLYRVTLESPFSAPVIDRKMRSLQPARFAAQFKLVDVGGTLQPAKSLF